MKRAIFIGCAALLALLLAACGSTKGIDVSGLVKSEYNTADQSRDVVMTLEETSVTPDTETLNLHLSNSSGNEYTFGMEPRLEVESAGDWYVVNPVVDAYWIEIAYVLEADGVSDMEFPLKDYYGNLSEGHYRIVKLLFSEAGNTFVIAEFTIEK